MILQINPKLRILNNNERIHKNDRCYGRTTSGEVKWCSPGSLKGKKWKKYDPFSPSIIMRKKSN